MFYTRNILIDIQQQTAYGRCVVIYAASKKIFFANNIMCVIGAFGESANSVIQHNIGSYAPDLAVFSDHFQSGYCFPLEQLKSGQRIIKSIAQIQ